MWNLSETNFEKKINSWSCGKKVQVKFTGSDNPNDPYETGSGRMKNRSMGHTDWVTSLSIKSFDSKKEGAMTVFNGADCQGHSATFGLNQTYAGVRE